MDALGKAAQFVSKACHPDVALLVKLDKLAELEGLSNVFVDDSV